MLWSQKLVYQILHHPQSYLFFFFNDTATTEIYTLSLHDALPIYPYGRLPFCRESYELSRCARSCWRHSSKDRHSSKRIDRKSTRLNSSHGYISYAVFCLKKKIHTAGVQSALTPPRNASQQSLSDI